MTASFHIFPLLLLEETLTKITHPTCFQLKTYHRKPNTLPTAITLDAPLLVCALPAFLGQQSLIRAQLKFCFMTSFSTPHPVWVFAKCKWWWLTPLLHKCWRNSFCSHPCDLSFHICAVGLTGSSLQIWKLRQGVGKEQSKLFKCVLCAKHYKLLFYIISLNPHNLSET